MPSVRCVTSPRGAGVGRGRQEEEEEEEEVYGCREKVHRQHGLRVSVASLGFIEKSIFAHKHLLLYVRRRSC